MRNIVKRLDLVGRVPEELWTEVRNIVQEAVIKPVSLSSQRHNEKLPEVTGTSRGNPGFSAMTMLSYIFCFNSLTCYGNANQAGPKF